MTVEDGWEHLDIRPLPHIEHVQDATDLANFRDGTFDRVIAQDVIEHIGWRLIPDTLREWLRVLKPGGTLEVETPNARELHQILMRPNDPSGRRASKHGVHESQFEYFNRVLFGHQDYPENTHKSYFTPEWLQRLLADAGAGEVTVMSSDNFRFRLAASK